MSNKLFKIESYDELSDTILVIVSGTRQEIIINKSKFEKWLDVTDRLTWEVNGPNHNGDHIQQIGKMEMDEYWNGLHDSQIKHDLYEYIVCKMIDHKKMGERMIDDVKSCGESLFKHMARAAYSPYVPGERLEAMLKNIT